VPRAGLDGAVVVERAGELLDQRPGDSLSLAVVADSLGVRAPSLYKHVDGLPGLHRGLVLLAKGALADTLRDAVVGRSGDDAVTALADAYRRWALAHPGQYPLTVRAPLEGDADDLAVSERATSVVYTALGGYGLDGDDAVDATRFLRAALHGFVSLETSGAFALPVDLERSWQRAVQHVVAALAAW
jgi:AcrR family transcriptional regulator